MGISSSDLIWISYLESHSEYLIQKSLPPLVSSLVYYLTSLPVISFIDHLCWCCQSVYLSFASVLHSLASAPDS
jgi:hypothetical protein